MCSVWMTRWALQRLGARAGAGAGQGQAQLAQRAGYDTLSTDCPTSITHLCRLCARPGHTPLLMSVGDFDIVSAIRTVTNITISHEDCYPKYICDDCLDELKTALMFKQKCIKTDIRFRELIQEEPNPDMPANFVQHDFNVLVQEMVTRREVLRKRKLAEAVKRMRMEKKIAKVSKPINQFKCISCDIPFYDRDRLEKHRALRTCARRPCPVCRKLVLNLPIHMYRQHRRRPWKKCPECGKLCRTITLLKTHMSVHSTECNFSCHLCPYRGKRQSYLTLHMRTHTGERPYLCEHCPATFLNVSNFKKHTLTHATKQFECAKCSKSFLYKSSLIEHENATHLNIRYTCKLCTKLFSYRSQLLKHELKVHKREKHTIYQPLSAVSLNGTTEEQVCSQSDKAQADQQILQQVDQHVEEYYKKIESAYGSDDVNDIMSEENIEVVEITEGYLDYSSNTEGNIID